MNPSASRRHAEATLAEITDLIEGVFAAVGTIRAQLLALITSGRPADRKLLAELRPLLTEVLAQYHDLAQGAGVILAPDVLADAPRWLEWWVAGAPPQMLHVNLHPDSPDFFDYTAAEWYREPVRSGHRWVTGPYVDYLATNRYLVTLSTPIRHEGSLYGVAGVDLVAGKLEDHLVATLSQLRRPAILVNHKNRVVASSTARWLTGDPAPAEASESPTPNWLICTQHGLPWRLLLKA